MIRNLLIRLAGYDPATLAEEPRHRTHLVTLAGAAVGLAICTTSVCWAFAGYGIAGGEGVRCLIGGGIAGAFGGLVTLTIDRAGVFAMDALSRGRGVQAAFYFARLALAVLLGNFSVHAILPRLFEHEAMAYALRQRTADEAARLPAVKQRFAIDDLRGSVGNAEGAVAAATTAAATVPAEIHAAELDAQACWRTYPSQRAALVAKGIGQPKLGWALAATAARCKAVTDSARQRLAAWRTQAEGAIEDAKSKEDEARAGLAKAEQHVAQRLEDDDRIERDSVTSDSATVIEAAVASDWGAWKKYYSAYAIIILLEILPLLLKGTLGQSVVGAKWSADHQVELENHRRRASESVHAAEQHKKRRDVFDAAADAALTSQETNALIQALFMSKIEAFVPLEVARRIVAEMEIAIATKQASERRNPSAAEAIAATWQQAFDEVAAALRTPPTPRGVPA